MIVFGMRRLGAALLVAWLAVTLAFVALRWAPGDAVDATMARVGASPAEIAARRETLGLNDPLTQQYAAYFSICCAVTSASRWYRGRVSAR